MSTVVATDLQNVAMTEDLLARIQREMHERLRELRGAVDEHDRLAAELRALDVPVQPAPNVRRGSVGCESPYTQPHARIASPKAARLMHAPRRPSLDRHGLTLARMSTPERTPVEHDLVATHFSEIDPIDSIDSIDSIPGIDEVDAEAEAYERSL